MKRRIIIITNAGKVGSENYCEGVFRDRENYITFFKAAYGGFYADTEIRPFDKPSKLKVREELKSLENDSIEFSIIIFCGHGWYSTISNSSIFHLNDSEQIDSLEFRAGGKKRIIIEDNCRKPYAEYIAESVKKAFSAMALSDSRQQQLNPELCKLFYNKTISECQEQIIIGQACDISEVAGDSSSNGGYYSSSLIKATETKVRDGIRTIDLSKSYITFSFPSCHMDAIPLVRSLSGNKQNPQIEKPRFSNGENYLPFAVIA